MSSARKLRATHSILVWFDCKDLDDLTICSLSELFQIILPVNNYDQCLQLLESIQNEEVTLVVPNELLESMGPAIQSMSHVNSVYIYFEEQINLEEWKKLIGSKLTGLFNDLLSRCRLLQRMSQSCHTALLSLEVLPPKVAFNCRPENKLNPLFLWTQLLKGIILESDNDSEALRKMFNGFRQKFSNNPGRLTEIDEAEIDYFSEGAIKVYTKYLCFYSDLNTALRLQDVQTILQFGPYLRALHEHIKRLHASQYSASSFIPFTVHRGQNMSKDDFDNLKNNIGGLFSFNSFLSTSLDKPVASILADSNASSNNENFRAIQWSIDIKHSQNDVPFANISEISHFKEENEILFSMHTIFRIKDIKPSENNSCVWLVQLESTDDSDDIIKILTEEFRRHLDELTSQHRIPSILLSLGYTDPALQIYQQLFQSTNDKEERAVLHLNIGDIKSRKSQHKEAIVEFQKAISMYEEMIQDGEGEGGRVFTSRHAAKTYSKLASAYGELAEYGLAIYHLIRGMEIEPLMIDHAHTYVSLLEKEGLSTMALKAFESILNIQARNTSEGHPAWIPTYNKIGSVYMDLEQYGKACDVFQKALNIAQTFLPPDHPYFRNIYAKIADAYVNMDEYQLAHENYQKALEMYENSSCDESSLANFYTELIRFYVHCEEYETALYYWRESVSIKKKILPADHIDFAAMDFIQARLYSHWKKYDKAFPLFQTAFHKFRCNPSAEDSALAECCSQMGQMWYNLGIDREALYFYKHALDICEKTSSNNRKARTCWCTRIADIYRERNDYGEALAYYELAKSITERVLSADHPTIQFLNSKIEFTEILMKNNVYSE